MFEELASNPLIQGLSFQNPYDYMWEATFFLVFLQIFDNLKADGLKARPLDPLSIIRVGCRAFGGLFWVVPICMGQMPSSVLTGIDRYMIVYVVAVVFQKYLRKLVPEAAWPAFAVPMKFAYAIFFANCCATGTIQGAQAFQGSRLAPLFMGMLATLGGSIAENGITGFLNKRELTKDQLLGVVGPCLFSLCTGAYFPEVVMPEAVARTVLVLFRLSAESAFVDYNNMLSNILGFGRSLVNRVSRAIPMKKGGKRK